jgi:TonB family protein
LTVGRENDETTRKVTRDYAVLWTWAASIAVHAVLAAGVLWLAYGTLHEREREAAMAAAAQAPVVEIAIELPPGSAEGSSLADRPKDAKGDPPEYHGGATTARLDTGAPGHGGDLTAPSRAVNLGDREDRMRLSPDLLSHLDRDQEARIRSARERETMEDRRSTTHPMELVFLASGSGERQERRAPSETDPSRGGAAALEGSVQGGETGTRAQEHGDEEEQREVGAARLGSRASASGLGVHDAKAGQDHRVAAKVTHARPDVTLASVSVAADVRGRTRDDIDSEQEVATTVRSLVHASTSGGMEGEGRGGSGGGGDPGVGGLFGFGSQGRPMGPGENDSFDLSTRDGRLMPYFRKIHAKVEPLWANAFPKSALLELKQGMVILEVTISADGSASVAWPPMRPSGIDEFDRNCFAAIRRAAPFDPIPPELHRNTLRIRMPFDAQNPIVK